MEHLHLSRKNSDCDIRYGACPENDTCAFSGRLTHHCTVAGGVGYEKIFNWPPWKEPLPRRFFPDNFLVPACGPCSVDLSANSDLGASLFQVLRVTGLQRLSSCANWSFDERCPNSSFLHRGLHGGLFLVFIVKAVPISSCTNCQHMSSLVSVHLIGWRDRHLSKLQ